ncbi:MAG: DNA translocase FtsK 4TM domain-containing protein, partial [Patescibacteria group bacterium]
MARPKDLGIKQKIKFWDEMRPETLQAIFAILSFLLAILSLMSAFGKVGRVGDYSFIWLTRLFGIGYYLIPAIFIMLTFTFLKGLKKKFEVSKAIGAIVFFISGLGLIHIASNNAAGTVGAGGTAGRIIASPLIKLIDIWASAVLLTALVVISLFIIFEAKITLEQLAFWRWFKKEKLEGIGKNEKNKEIDEDEEARIDKAVSDMNDKSFVIPAKAGIQNPNGAGNKNKKQKIE